MHRHTAPVVLKLGGSLLDLPDLRQRLGDVLRRYADSPRLLVVGGGRAADLVREQDRLHALEADTAHRLALEAMTLNSRGVASLIPDALLVDTLEQCRTCWRAERTAIINATMFVPSLEKAAADPLPHTWDATSDSISAWIAGSIAADRLVLLKSVDCPEQGAVQENCDAVDPLFPTMCRRVPSIEWMNLRTSHAQACEVSFG